MLGKRVEGATEAVRRAEAARLLSELALLLQVRLWLGRARRLRSSAKMPRHTASAGVAVPGSVIRGLRRPLRLPMHGRRRERVDGCELSERVRRGRGGLASHEGL